MNLFSLLIIVQIIAKVHANLHGEELFEASNNGDLETVKNLLNNSDVDVNYNNRTQWHYTNKIIETPLIKARLYYTN